MSNGGAKAGKAHYEREHWTAQVSGWSPGTYHDAEDNPANARPVTCEICKQSVAGGEPDALCRDADDYREENWVAMGPKGLRDIRGVADPRTDVPGWGWRFFHCKCIRDVEQHAPNHPSCTRPRGPCTDWHLRGRCKREWKCDHCHFHHPELKEKYPDLPAGGILRRPQRRERLAMLKKAYEEEVAAYMNGYPPNEYEPEGEDGLVDASPQPASSGERYHARASSSWGGGITASSFLALLNPAETTRVAGVLRVACAPGSEGYHAVKPLLEDSHLTPIVTRFVELLQMESQQRCSDEELHSRVRQFLDKGLEIGRLTNRLRVDVRDEEELFLRIDAVAEFCVASRAIEDFIRRVEEILACWPRR